jgi:prepilin-type N-terminal cleavage/methylation domain-containing protein
MKSETWISRRLGQLARDDGFTLVELLAAIVVLIVGIFGAYTAFDASRRLSLVSERHGTMAQIAQQEIERIEGTPYGQIGLNATPAHSSDTTNPNYYVTAGSPSTLQYDRAGSATENLDVDATKGTVVPSRTWSEVTQGGTLTGNIYDYITWSSDSQCAPGCPASQDYKRITVAVTMTQGLHPSPVYVSSVIADPEALPTGGIVNGNSNPLKDPDVNCQTPTGATGPCTSGLNQGTGNTYFLHNWAASKTGSPTTPAADNATHSTVGITTTGGLCATTPVTATPTTEANCPTPDLMDTNPPTGTATTPAYNYSTDQCADTCYTGGRVLQPTCAGTWTAAACAGSGTSADCSAGAWSNTLQNPQSELWVTPALASATTFTGAGGLSFFTQTIAAATPVVSFCVEVYDVPPSGTTAGSVADLLAWPPVAKGGAAYIPPTDPTSGGNWPSTMTASSFVFTFSQTPVTIPAGDRVGFRIWVRPNQNSPIAVLYDNPNYPAQLQLNSQ